MSVISTKEMKFCENIEIDSKVSVLGLTLSDLKYTVSFVVVFVRI